MGYAHSKTKVSIRDTYETPQWLVSAIDNDYSPDVDLACTEENKKFAAGITYPERDSLAENWLDWGGVGFCNPPYSNIYPWLEKARLTQIQAAKSGLQFKSVWVLPNLNGARWQRLACLATELIFINGRVFFINSETGQPVNGNNAGTVIAIYDSCYLGRTPVCSVDRDHIIESGRLLDTTANK